jgi:LssY-like putative type I secretion system component LssY
MRNKLTKWLIGVGVALAAYVLSAYLLLPDVWRHYEHQPGLAVKPMVTHTGEGIAGDPLNVGLVGGLDEVMGAMKKAGWSRADPISFKSGMEVAESVTLDRPYKQAPVSNLYYEGRKEDIAFEKQIGRSPAQRHHVRFWKVLESGVEGRNVWLGSATLDRSVGFSKYTGQVTHHIAPDIDTERQLLIDDLAAAFIASTIYTVSGVGPTINGRNGEGDSYYTDGELEIAVIAPGANPQPSNPIRLDEPLSIAIKNSLWKIYQ